MNGLKEEKEKRMPETVILVDEDNREIGVMEKMLAHQKGKLHRAFSVFLFSPTGNILLQRRALQKYHCGGLWTNTCCSHPRPGETLSAAVKRRLQEELSITCTVSKAFEFIYRAEFDNGLIEHEFDSVFIGEYEGPVRPNAEEVMEFQWFDSEDLAKQMQNNAEQFTPWFKIAYPRILKEKSANISNRSRQSQETKYPTR